MDAYENTGTFIVLNVPSGTVFGIDLKSWTTGEKFRGVKGIPPGQHFAFFNASDGPDYAPRFGCFHTFRAGELVVRKWDTELEMPSMEPVPQSEVVSLKDNLAILDGFLGPYPIDIHDKWTALTRHITPALVERLSPSSGTVRSVVELEGVSDADRPKGNAQPLTFGQLPILKPVVGTDLRLTPVPSRHYPEGATPQQITEHSLDSSYRFESICKQYESPNELLAELEFCFVCFLVGHSLEAFEHWKRLVTLFCGSAKAIERYTKLYRDFVDVFELHVLEVPEELLADIVTNNNVIYTNCRMLLRNVRESNVCSELKMRTERFVSGISKQYGWDFSNVELDDEEDAPVIVNSIDVASI